MDRGGPIPTFAAPWQQQCGDQHVATPPPTTRADGQPGGPPSVHPQAQARGGGCGMTVQQQAQRTSAEIPPSASLLARHALNFYRECVRAGQWARLVFEQQREGESISLFTRPMAAPVTDAARGGSKKRKRRPNQKRVEKKTLWRKSRNRTPAAATPRQQQQAEDVSPGRQRQPGPPGSQQFIGGVSSLGAAVTAEPTSVSYAMAAVTAARRASFSLMCTIPPQAAAAPIGAAVNTAAADQATATASESRVISPKLTRASKKRRGMSDTDAFLQLDGAGQSPPSTPESTPPREPASPASAGPPSPPPPSSDQPPPRESAPPLPPPPWHVGSPSAPTCPPYDGGVGSPSAPTSPPLAPPPWHVGSPTAPTCPPSYADAAQFPPPARQPVKIVAEKNRMVICQVCNLKKHIPGQRCCIKCMSEGH